MNKVICIECSKEMKPLKCGVVVLEHDDDGKPYKLWSADLLKCPRCGRKVVSRFGNEPIAQHFEVGFADQMKEARYEF